MHVYTVALSTHTTEASDTEAGVFHNQNSTAVDNIMNEVEQCLDLSSTSFNPINNNQEDNLNVLDDDKELDTLTSWSIAVGEIEWCKTNRDNDRLCMCGFTYDFISQSLKRKPT